MLNIGQPIRKGSAYRVSCNEIFHMPNRLARYSTLQLMRFCVDLMADVTNFHGKISTGVMTPTKYPPSLRQVHCV